MKENKYKNSKIYKIVDVAYSGKCYVGSTCESLSQRMARHKYMYNQYTKSGTEGHRSAHAIFDEYGVENCKIELIEEFPCENKMELHKREGYFIKENDCVNKRVEGRTDKEYRKDNKEWERERHKRYKEANKEKIKEKYEMNKHIISQKAKIHREKNKEEIQKQKRTYRENNKDTIAEGNKKYYQGNKAMIREKGRTYYQENKEKLNEKVCCECGGQYALNVKAAHFKTQKHQNYLKQKLTEF